MPSGRTQRYQPNGNDVVMVVKHRMASLEVSHIILMVPVADLGCLHGLPLQPQGAHLRRPVADSGLEESAHCGPHGAPCWCHQQDVECLGLGTHTQYSCFAM